MDSVDGRKREKPTQGYILGAVLHVSMHTCIPDRETDRETERHHCAAACTSDSPLS